MRLFVSEYSCIFVSSFQFSVGAYCIRPFSDRLLSWPKHQFSTFKFQFSTLPCYFLKFFGCQAVFFLKETPKGDAGIETRFGCYGLDGQFSGDRGDQSQA